MGPQPIAIFGIGQRFDGKPTTISRRFRAHNVRDFAVLMSEDYVVKSKPFTVGAKSVTVESYTTKANAAKADKAIDIAGRSLQIFARRFGPYPYSSFKVVEGPIKGGAGGMEYSGMTAIASMLYGDWGKQIEALAGSMGLGGMDKLFADEADGATEGRADAGAAGGFVQGMLGEQKQMLDSIFETTIAHEVAHQWWAIGVGSDSVRAPFVDESLTNYCAMLYFEDRYGKEKAQQMMDVHLRTTYSMGRMLGSADVPVALKTSAYGNNLQYGAIVYGKGALYYDALRALVGDEVFFAALRRYYLEYSNKLAGQRTLLDMMKQAAPAKAPQIEALFARWIEGTNGDADITGGKPAGLSDLLGGILGGNLPGALPGEE
jgi:aminopeptidase N